MGDPAGVGEAHTGLHSGPGGDRYDGIAFASSARDEAEADRLRGEPESLRQRAGEWTEQARSLAGDLGSRASTLASAASERAAGLRDRAHDELERRGLLDRIRDNPLPVLGLAFAAGFLLAGGDHGPYGSDDSTRAQRARRELRAALVGGLSAGVAQGASGFFQHAGDGGGGFIDSLIRGLLGEDHGNDDEPRSRSGREGSGPRRTPRYAER